MKKVRGERRKKRAGGIMLLDDLAPRKDVKGGAGKIVFGAGADPFLKEEEQKKPKKKSQMRKGVRMMKKKLAMENLKSRREVGEGALPIRKPP